MVGPGGLRWGRWVQVGYGGSRWGTVGPVECLLTPNLKLRYVSRYCKLPFTEVVTIPTMGLFTIIPCMTMVKVRVRVPTGTIA